MQVTAFVPFLLSVWTEILLTLVRKLHYKSNTNRNYFKLASDTQQGKVQQINTKLDKITPQLVPQIEQDYIADLM